MIRLFVLISILVSALNISIFAQDCISITQAANIVRHYVSQQDAHSDALSVNPYEFYYKQQNDLFSCSKTDFLNNIRRSRIERNFNTSAFCFSRRPQQTIYASLNLSISCHGQVRLIELVLE